MQIHADFTTSVKRALEETDPNYLDYPGHVICGSHTPRDVEKLIEIVAQCRVTGTPFYGECYGHQLAAIEYARNVLGIKDATSEEFGQETFVVKKLPKLKVGLHEGESYWNYYEVDPAILDQWQKAENFITCQFHASYQSRKNKPHPLLTKFIYEAKLAM